MSRLKRLLPRTLPIPRSIAPMRTAASETTISGNDVAIAMNRLPTKASQPALARQFRPKPRQPKGRADDEHRGNRVVHNRGAQQDSRVLKLLGHLLRLAYSPVLFVREDEPHAHE